MNDRDFTSRQLFCELNDITCTIGSDFEVKSLSKSPLQEKVNETLVANDVFGGGAAIFEMYLCIT